MAYGLKLFYQWKVIDNEDFHRVEIQEEGFIGTAIEAIPLSDPFTVEYPERDFYDALCGSGATLSFIYKGSEDLKREFFTNNLKQYKVVFKIGNSIRWSGYLNTELYDEDFSMPSDTLGVEMNLTANDGIGILDRIKFLDPSTGNPYRRLVSFWECIDLCLSNIDIYTYAYTINGITPFHLDYDDIFYQSHCKSSNFYDEDGEPAMLSEALKSWLDYYDLQIKIVNNIPFIYGVDYISNADTNILFDVRFVGDGTVSSTVTFGKTINLSNIGYYETGQRLASETGVSKQIISLDPYVRDFGLTCEVNNEELITGYTDDSGIVGSGNTYYSWRRWSNHEHYTILDETKASFRKITVSSTHPTDSDEEFFCINVIPNVGNGTGAYCFKNNIITQPFSLGPYWAWDCEFFIRTGDGYKVPTGPAFYFIGLKFQIKYGDYYYSRPLYTSYNNAVWTTTPSDYNILLPNSNPEKFSETMTDRWIAFEDFDNVRIALSTERRLKRIFLQNGIYSDLEISMSSNIAGHYLSNGVFYRDDSLLSNVQDIWVRKFDAFPYYGTPLVGDSPNAITNSIEYVGEGDSNYKEEGDTITHLFGSKDVNSNNHELRSEVLLKNPSESNFSTMKDLISYKSTNYYLPEFKLENILTRKRLPTLKLSVNLNMVHPVSLITGFESIEDKKFAFTGGSINYRNYNVDGTWTEVKYI